jgi:hypothetical protein
MRPILAVEKYADFFTAQHVHVLLNHLPVFGLVLGVLALVVALCLRSRPAQIVALAVVLMAAVSTVPVIITGQRAFDLIEGIVDDDGDGWLDAHKDRAEDAAPAFYVLIAFSAAALFAPRKWPRSAMPLLIATLVLSIGCAVATFWIALAGGEIRHPEFRTGPPPPKKEAEEQHRHSD